MYDQYGNKLVRKAIPYQLYDMAGLQQWFEEMSAKGFLLDSFGIRTGIFRVGEPAPGVRYRLEPQTYWDQSLDYDKNEAYAKWAGSTWTLSATTITSIGRRTRRRRTSTPTP